MKIEKRAERYADISGVRSSRDWRSVKQCCFEIATEQDRIARVEERERCINAIRNVSCALCLNNDDPDRCKATNCLTKYIIKAIEEGGNK